MWNRKKFIETFSRLLQWHIDFSYVNFYQFAPSFSLKVFRKKMNTHFIFDTNLQSLNPFHTNNPFLHPLKKLESQRFSGVIRGCRNGLLTWDMLKMWRRPQEMWSKFFLNLIYSNRELWVCVGIWMRALREKCPDTEFFLVSIFLYSAWIQETTHQKKLRI